MKLTNPITENLFYITPDAKRAFGLERVLPNFFIICARKDSIVDIARKNGVRIFCLEEAIGDLKGGFRSSSQLLAHKKVQSHILENSKGKKSHVLYFKPNLKADVLCRELGYEKVGNSHALNEQFENKVNFFEVSASLVPQNHIKGFVETIGAARFSEITAALGLPFVVQFGHGWAGNTTFRITSEVDFKILAEKFAFTNARFSKYISGKTYLNNCCIYNDRVLKSNPAVQLNDIPLLSNRANVTCGRQWPAPSLTNDQKGTIMAISQKIGEAMMQKGYRGFFGLDFLVEDSSGKVYLSENNARFTASAPFFTKQEILQDTIPLMYFHIAAFLHYDLPSYNVSEFSASQLIIRKDDRMYSPVHKLKTGVYGHVDNALEFKYESYDSEKTANNEMFIHETDAQGPGKIDDELARIEIKKMVLDYPGKLTKDLEKTVKLVRNLM